MLIVEEARWRVYGLWVVAALFVVPALARPSMTLLLVAVGSAAIISWIQQRRQRASLTIDDGEIIVANRYSTYRLPRKGARVELAAGRVWGVTGDRDIDRELNVGKQVVIVPADPHEEPVTVDAVHGLLPREFQRVLAEIRSVLGG